MPGVVQTQDRRARRAAVMPLLKPEIEKALRFARRTVNGLVVVLALPSLWISPKINADQSGASSTRNNLTSSLGRSYTSCPEEAHNSHTCAVEIRCYGGSTRVLLIWRLSDYRGSRRREDRASPTIVTSPVSESHWRFSSR
jgi:hypothetical protein